jgi:hypothetical protein
MIHGVILSLLADLLGCRAPPDTGSATVVNGQVVLMYPGLCEVGVAPNCTTGTTLDIAMAADPSDAFMVNWSKAEYNPVVNNSQRGKVPPVNSR